MSIQKIGSAGRTYRHIKRYRQILSIFLKYGFGNLLGNLRVDEYAGTAWRTIHPGRAKKLEGLSRAERVRRALEELGPSFIKMGQILSTRPDLLPADLVQEFAKLQEDVPAFPLSDVKHIIEEELHEPLEQVFPYFEEQPLAAASIGQVHAARLHSGEEVVVKVQRPAIRATIEIDMEIMLHMATLAERHLDGGDIYKPTRIVREFARTLQRELDYDLEAAHAERFAAQFANDVTIHVPRIYRSVTTSRVLTMERVRGIRGTETDLLADEGLDGPELARRGFDQMLRQVFVYGFFHGDPHPGNIRILPGNVICYLDFGMMGRVSKEKREGFLDLLAGVARRDETKATVTLLKLVAPEVPPDHDLLEQDVAEIMDRFSYRPLKELHLGSLLIQLMEVVVRHRLRVPPDLYLMAKALATIEGLGRALDPDFDAMEHAVPFIRRMQLERLDPRTIAKDVFDSGTELFRLLREIPGEVREILKQARRGEVRVKFEHRGLEPMLSTYDRISNRVAFAIVLASLVVGSALIVLSGVPPRWHEIPLIGLAGFMVAAVMGFLLLLSILRGGKM